MTLRIHEVLDDRLVIAKIHENESRESKNKFEYIYYKHDVFKKLYLTSIKKIIIFIYIVTFI